MARMPMCEGLSPAVAGLKTSPKAGAEPPSPKARGSAQRIGAPPEATSRRSPVRRKCRFPTMPAVPGRERPRAPCISLHPGLALVRPSVLLAHLSGCDHRTIGSCVLLLPERMNAFVIPRMRLSARRAQVRSEEMWRHSTAIRANRYYQHLVPHHALPRESRCPKPPRRSGAPPTAGAPHS